MFRIDGENMKSVRSGLSGCVAILLLWSATASAEPPWEIVARDRERVAEIDRSTIIQSDAGSKVAWGRIVLSAERAAADGYASVKALNRYDCYNRSFFTIKRVYMDARHVVIREEGGLGDTPVLAAKNSVDERMWQEVCKPVSVSELERLALDAARIVEAARVDSSGAAAGRAQSGEKAAAMAAPVRTPDPERGASARPDESRRAVRSKAEPAWSFEGKTGPQNWGRMKREWAVCARGMRQSPIDLRNAVVVDLEPPRFDYRETYFSISDMGHTLRVDVPAGMGVELRGMRFQLEHVEFYRPSAARVGGQAADMEVHFHHRSADGQRAVVGLLVATGEQPHSVVNTLWRNLPLERGVPHTPGEMLKLAALLPVSAAHFQFMGSLVTPPCTEGVLWVVMKEPLQLSAEQIGVFARLYPRNGRPIQPQNGRLILESR
jgi:carbonic anhydrase